MIFMKGAKIFQWDDLFNKCCWKYLIPTCKQQLWNLPHTIYIKSKWVIPLDKQAKNIKFLEENTGEKSLLSCLGKVFIHVLLGFDFFFWKKHKRHEPQKKNMINCIWPKLWTLCFQRLIKKVKRQQPRE